MNEALRFEHNFGCKGVRVIHVIIEEFRQRVLLAVSNKRIHPALAIATVDTFHLIALENWHDTIQELLKMAEAKRVQPPFFSNFPIKSAHSELNHASSLSGGSWRTLALIVSEILAAAQCICTGKLPSFATVFAALLPMMMQESSFTISEQREENAEMNGE